MIWTVIVYLSKEKHNPDLSRPNVDLIYFLSNFLLFILFKVIIIIIENAEDQNKKLQEEDRKD